MRWAGQGDVLECISRYISVHIHTYLWVYGINVLLAMHTTVDVHTGYYMPFSSFLPMQLSLVTGHWSNCNPIFLHQDYLLRTYLLLWTEFRGCMYSKMTPYVELES